MLAARALPASAHGHGGSHHTDSHHSYAASDWTPPAQDTWTPGPPAPPSPEARDTGAYIEDENEGCPASDLDVSEPLGRVTPEEWKAFFSSWPLQEKIVYPVMILYGK